MTPSGPRLDDLVEFIITSHHAYVRRAIPDITARLRVLALASGSPLPLVSLVRQTFDSLAAALLAHLDKEEHILFPYIRELVCAADTGRPLSPGPFGTVANPVRMMEHEHQSAMLDLDRLDVLTDHYAVPSATVPGLADAWAALRAFDADLREHVRLEDQVLFPHAVDLEVQFT
jgi:regulator of cell morphogenesis and NO signaling